MSMYNPYGGGGAQVLPPDVVQRLLGQQGAAAPQRTAISDLVAYLSDLPSEHRRAVESSPDYLRAKAVLMEGFVLHGITNTPQGVDYILGPGAAQAQRLLDVARDAGREAEKTVVSETEKLRLLVEQQAQELAQLKRRVGDADAASAD